MSRPTLLTVPYHLGGRGVGPGAGVPALAAALAGAADVVSVELGEEAPNEIAASMPVVRALAERVRALDFPVVLAGDCSSARGTVTGIGGRVGVVSFDGHGDFPTPDTTESGFCDGMGLAMLTGSGLAALRAGLAVVPEEHVVHVGGRDLEPSGRERFHRSRVAFVRRPPLDEALDALRERVEDVYVHVDLDVLDPAVGRANECAAPDGLRLAELETAIDAVHARFRVRAAALTADDPAADPERRLPVAARAVFERPSAQVAAR